MLRLLAAAAVLAFATAAAAGPLSRWTSMPLEAAERMVAGGPDGSTVVVLRSNRDPLRSFDGGQTWTPFTVQGARPVDVQIAPDDSRTWYATAGRVIYRSRNGGDAWEERSRGFVAGQWAPLIGPDTNVLYLAQLEPPLCDFLCSGPIYHLVTSTDGGLTWLDRDPQFRVTRLVASPVDSRVAFALTGYGGQGEPCNARSIEGRHGRW